MQPCSNNSQPTPTLHTLLYVEHNPVNEKVVARIIESRPAIRLLTTEDGYRGIELARSAIPDAIILDIDSPKLDARDFMQLLQHETFTAHIPVLAVTTDASSAANTGCLTEIFSGYFSYPYDIAAFLAALDLAIQISVSKTYRGQTLANGFKPGIESIPLAGDASPTAAR